MTYLFAYLGGLLLNLMPCVLPVVALKAAGISHSARGHLLFAGGVLSVFAGLATAAASLGLMWGGQFQNQPFLIGLVLLVLACGLAYLGVWELPGVGARGQQHSFFAGVLATLIATPCSGPLLGPVFGATLAATPLTTFGIFMAIGLGMATPYLLLAAGLRRFVPRPGAWMETVKKIAGFSLLGTAVWLLYGVESRWLFPALGSAVLLAACLHFRNWMCWLNLSMVAGLLFFLAPANPLPWQPYSDELFEELRAEGRPVMVQFTAPLCLTCQTNELLALNKQRVRQRVEAYNVACLRAEMPAGSELLRKLGYNSVPMLAVYSPEHDEPVCLPDLITEQHVEASLEWAMGHMVPIWFSKETLDANQ